MTAWDSLAAQRPGIPVFAPGHVWLAGAAGIQATLRGINRAVVFAAGHGADENFDWAPLVRTGAPIVLYMVMHNLERIVAAMIEAGLAVVTVREKLMRADASATKDLKSCRAG